MKPYRVLVTGSRDWTDWPLLQEALESEHLIAIPRPMVVVQGGARGADTMARTWALRQLGVESETHEAAWRPGGVYNPQAGIVRNRLMVSKGADVCLAFIRNGSRGASNCARLAAEAGIPVNIYRA